jgi:hypothetical protein
MDNVKEISGENVFQIVQRMTRFQVVHNELRKDFLTVYHLALKSRNDSKVPNALVRACVKELFTLIEADVYMYNQYNPYKGFDDKDPILTKFKKTFKHHGKEFNKYNNVLAFNSRHLKSLKEAKTIRDAITHPKGIESIQVSEDDLTLVHEVYIAYTKFVNQLMTGTAIQFSLPALLKLH